MSIPLLARAEPAPLPYQAVEGPFASVEQYCQRLALIKATCTVEKLDVPLPAVGVPVRAIRLLRVRADKSWHWNRSMLAIETSKGLYVDEQMNEDHDAHGVNDSIVRSITTRTSSGRPIVVAQLHGSTGAPRVSRDDMKTIVGADGYDEITQCWVGADGTVACYTGSMLIEHAPSGSAAARS